jgi:hypothetical protein
MEEDKRGSETYKYGVKGCLRRRTILVNNYKTFLELQSKPSNAVDGKSLFNAMLGFRHVYSDYVEEMQKRLVPIHEWFFKCSGHLSDIYLDVSNYYVFPPILGLFLYENRHSTDKAVEMVRHYAKEGTAYDNSIYGTHTYSALLKIGEYASKGYVLIHHITPGWVLFKHGTPIWWEKSGSIADVVRRRMK